MDISNDLVEKLMFDITNTGSFREDQHSELFKEVSKFLFLYCVWSQSN